MADIAKKVLSWPASPSTDVVSYIVQYRENGSGEAFSEVSVPAKTPPSYIIPDEIPELAVDGQYEIRVVAVDDFGHRSDPGPAVSMTLDFIAPDPPGAPSLADYLPG